MIPILISDRRDAKYVLIRTLTGPGPYTGSSLCAV